MLLGLKCLWINHFLRRIALAARSHPNGYCASPRNRPATARAEGQSSAGFHRAGHPCVRAARVRAATDRAQHSADVDQRRDLELDARIVGPLLLRAEGRAGASALRHVPQSRAGLGLCVEGWTAGRASRAGDAIRSAWRIPADRRLDASRRRRCAVRALPQAEGDARGSRLVRGRAQTCSPIVPARDRRRYQPARRGVARRAVDAARAKSARARDRVSVQRPGKCRRRRHRVGDPRRKRARADGSRRRADRVSRWRFDRGFMVIQRRDRRARDLPVGNSGDQRRRT